MAGKNLAPGRDRAAWATAINGSFGRARESFLDVGRHLIDAKAALPHGEFGTMLADDLDFSPQTANKLMKIVVWVGAVKSRDSRDLPASWNALYELTQLDDDTFDGAVADGRITPGMSIADAKRLRREGGNGNATEVDDTDYATWRRRIGAPVRTSLRRRVDEFSGAARMPVSVAHNLDQIFVERLDTREHELELVREIRAAHRQLGVFLRRVETKYAAAAAP